MKVKTRKNTKKSAGRTGAAKPARSPVPADPATGEIVTLGTLPSTVPAEYDFGEADVAALLRANTALIKGFEAIGEAIYAYARSSLGSAVSTARAMIEARNLVDVVTLNREFAQLTLEGLVTNSARLSEIGVTATSEAFKPLGERVAVTIEKLHRPAATDGGAI